MDALHFYGRPRVCQGCHASFWQIHGTRKQCGTAWVGDYSVLVLADNVSRHYNNLLATSGIYRHKSILLILVGGCRVQIWECLQFARGIVIPNRTSSDRPSALMNPCGCVEEWPLQIREWQSSVLSLPSPKEQGSRARMPSQFRLERVIRSWFLPSPNEKSS